MLAKTPLKDQMIAWLQTKDPKETYDWVYPRTCACGQFAKAIGRYGDWILANTTAGSSEWSELDGAAYGNYSGDRTFGGLLRRLTT